MTNMTLNLRLDGISTVENFLTPAQVQKINTELDRIFSPGHLSINGYLGHVFGTANLKSVALPTASIRSVNLLELAVDINNILNEQDRLHEERVITALEIWQEENQPIPLFWQTDNREGMVRAFIYIKGGHDNSGAFRYMKGTHLRKEEILSQMSPELSKENKYYNNKLSEEQVETEKDNIITVNSGAGTLTLAYTEGFHCNQPRIDQRRVIMMEFQPKSKEDYPRSEIYLASSQLTEKVLSNISIFENKPQKTPHYYGTDVTISQPPTKQKKADRSNIRKTILYFKEKNIKYGREKRKIVDITTRLLMSQSPNPTTISEVIRIKHINGFCVADLMQITCIINISKIYNGEIHFFENCMSFRN